MAEGIRKNSKTKWIVVTGGVLSGLGKGTAAASIARLLKTENTKIVPVKCDGYLNVDPGTMNPIEHGEVFVLEDGGEVDMDFGHYERFLEVNCKFKWNLTSGKIFNSIIEKERRGDYLGKTIQIFPHVSDEIRKRLVEIAEEESPDIMLVEIGGTIGDIENSWFVQAAKQLKKDVGAENILYAHLTYVPYLDSVGELKTKPAQRDIELLRKLGINPNIIIVRSKEALSKKLKEKLAVMADLEPQQIIGGQDVKNIYELPLLFRDEGILNILSEKFSMPNNNLLGWENLVQKISNPKNEINIAICGKYTALHDSYASIAESLTHAGAHLDARINLKWVETTDIEEGRKSCSEILKDCRGVIIPGGFGGRGAEGKIEVVKYARENNIPFLGLCYGLQLAVVEFARNVCALAGANTTETDEKTKYPVIDILPEQKNVCKKGATMRLGAYEADIEKGTRVFELYKSEKVSERHRHRYEVNPEYHEILKKNGLVFSGTSCSKRLVEFIEIPNRKFFVATQSHPELKSRLLNPAPLFYGFVKACLN
jgi:CTP synthase